MAEMGAACVASAGKGVLDGSAAAMTVYPVVPDFEKYPGTGRDTTIPLARLVLLVTGLNIFYTTCLSIKQNLSQVGL
jgi:hypothetical protein